MLEGFLVANFVPLMFVGLLVFLLSGIPVAFALIGTGLTFGVLGMELGFQPEPLQCPFVPDLWNRTK